MANTNDAIKAIVDVLKADAGAGGVSTLTSGRIGYGEVNRDTVLPCVTLLLTTNEVDGTFGADALEAELQADSWTKISGGSVVCITLAERVFTVLQRTFPTVANWARLSISCRTRGTAEIDGDAWRVMQIYDLHAS